METPMTALARPEATQHTFTEFTGIEYLLIDIASNYGMDKENWSERLNWALEHENNILRDLDRMQKNSSYRSQYLVEAEEPALMFAGMQALEAARQGKPTGYAISLDATASGMQILAIMAGCEQSARACNVIPSSFEEDHREDAYTNLYKVMKEVLKELNTSQGSLQVTDEDTITRAQAKDAIKT